MGSKQPTPRLSKTPKSWLVPRNQSIYNIKLPECSIIEKFPDIRVPFNFGLCCLKNTLIVAGGTYIMRKYPCFDGDRRVFQVNAKGQVIWLPLMIDERKHFPLTYSFYFDQISAISRVQLSPSVESMNLTKNKWTLRPALKYPCQEPTAWYFKNYLFAFQGTSKRGCVIVGSARLEVNSSRQRWQALTINDNFKGGGKYHNMALLKSQAKILVFNQDETYVLSLLRDGLQLEVESDQKTIKFPIFDFPAANWKDEIYCFEPKSSKGCRWRKGEWSYLSFNEKN